MNQQTPKRKKSVVRPKIRSKKCIVRNCNNRAGEGSFKGNLCTPCHTFITTGQGRYSQMYRNSLGSVLQKVGESFLGGLVSRLDPTATVNITVKEIL